MKDTLHAYRETWMMGLSEQEIYLKMVPIATTFKYKLEEWEESNGACVDDVYFNSPESSHMIELTDRFIGRTECSRLCDANPLCAAFSA